MQSLLSCQSQGPISWRCQDEGKERADPVFLLLSVRAVGESVPAFKPRRWMCSSSSVPVPPGRGPCRLIAVSVFVPEIEMVIMERSKLPELAAGTSVQEQNTTDEEKSAATGLESAQWSR